MSAFIRVPARLVPHADSLFPQGGEVLDLVAVTLANTRLERREPQRSVFDSQAWMSATGVKGLRADHE